MKNEIIHTEMGDYSTEGGELTSSQKEVIAMLVNQSKKRIEAAVEQKEPQEETSVPTVLPANFDPMETPIWEIDKDALDPYADPPIIRTWATMGGRPAFEKQGIVLIQAKPKQGKSYSVYAALIPLLTMRPFGNIIPLEQPKLVLVFDLEMSRNTLTSRVFRQMKVLGDNGKRFIVFPIKHLPIDEAMPFIHGKIAKYAPDIVVIDHAGKLVENTNDERESLNVVNQFGRFPNDPTVFAIQHENFGSENSKARGSVGSHLTFAQTETYVATKDKGIFSLKLKEARDWDADDPEPFSYILNTEGYITDSTEAERENQKAECKKWHDNFSHVFGDDDEVSRTELKKRIIQMEGLSDTAADNAVTNAVKAGAIVKVNDSHRAPYRLALNCP